MKITPENRLLAILVTLDGFTADELLADTDKRAGALSDAVRNYVTDKLNSFPPVADEVEDPLLAECGVIGQIAGRIAAVADRVNLAALGAVARGIGPVSDSQEIGPRHRDALRLHVAALRLVGVTPGPATRADIDLLDHLQAMRDKLGFSP